MISNALIDNEQSLTSLTDWISKIYFNPTLLHLLQKIKEESLLSLLLQIRIPTQVWRDDWTYSTSLYYTRMLRPVRFCGGHFQSKMTTSS